MIDVNGPLKKAYKTALTGIVFNSFTVPVYATYLPDNIAAENYIVFGSVTNNAIGTINSQDTATSMRVTVYTTGSRNNNGDAADYIGGKVLERIHASPSFNIALPVGVALQMTGTTLESDTTQDYSLSGNKIYIDRILIFRHSILQK